MGAKSRFTFSVNNSAKATELIEGFLLLHQYEEQHANGVSWYMYSTPMAKYSFDYSINGNTLDILAYLGTPDNSSPLDDGIVGSMYKKNYLEELQPLFKELVALSDNAEPPVGVIVQDRDAHNGVCAQSTQHINAAHNRRINTLEPGPVDTSRFCEESTTKVDPSRPQITNKAHRREINKSRPSPYLQQSDSISDYEEQSKIANNKYAVIALIMAIIGMVATCFSYTFGIILQILTYILGYKGLKSKNRGMAIAAIVINVLTTVGMFAMIMLFVALSNV